MKKTLREKIYKKKSHLSIIENIIHEKKNLSEISSIRFVLILMWRFNESQFGCGCLYLSVAYKTSGEIRAKTKKNLRNLSFFSEFSQEKHESSLFWTAFVRNVYIRHSKIFGNLTSPSLPLLKLVQNHQRNLDYSPGSDVFHEHFLKKSRGSRTSHVWKELESWRT